jgi:putative tryptophan/tyrosine transport system substrate-binding protein
MSSPNSIPLIGFLGASTKQQWDVVLGAFEQRLGTLLGTKNKDFHIKCLWADGLQAKYDKHAATFVHRKFYGRKADVIVTGGTAATLACKKATNRWPNPAKRIPVVFATAGDPVRNKLVKTLRRPGGNVTGISNRQTDSAGQRFKILQEFPNLKVLGIIGNTSSPNVKVEIRKIRKLARQQTLHIRVFGNIKKKQDIATGIKALTSGRRPVDAIYVCTDPLVTSNAKFLNSLLKRVAIHALRENLAGQGLMSYGAQLESMFESAADFVDMILKGTKPADIPVKQVNNFEFVINIKTARKLGLTIPQALLAAADKVIE